MPELNDPFSGPVIRTQEAAPLQGQTVPFLTGVGAAFTRAQVGGVGVSLSAPVVNTAINGGPDNRLLDHDEAVAQLKALGPKFDPSVLPAGRVYQTTLDAIKGQQTVVNNASDAADRSSSAGGVAQFVAGLVGSASDPLFLALGPLGRLASGAGEAIGLVKGASIGVRAVTGAAEGGAVMGGYTEAQKHLGTAPGDRDITSYDVLKQTGIGMVIGGAVKAAVGQRPLTPETTARLEGSDIVAKKQGISVDNVVSPTGAIGKFQIEPNTARQYMGKDFDVSTLHDPAVNAHVNQVILDDLQKRFPDDMEAQAIAYNAGPGRAEKWIAAGRNDSVLPLETQKYVAHLRTIRDQSPLAEAAALPPEVKTAAMTTAVAQVAQDSEVNVDPIIKNGLAEKAQEMNEAGRSLRDRIKAGENIFADPPQENMSDILANVRAIREKELLDKEHGVYNPIVPEAPPPIEDAIPKPGSAITNERLTADMLAQVNEAAKVKAPEGSEFDEVNKQAADAEKIAEHAHAMAFGEPEGRIIGPKELGFEEKMTAEGTTYRQGDMKAAGEALQAYADAALAQGRKVTLHVDGKEIPITQPGMKDAKGQRWGAMNIISPKKGERAELEIAPIESGFKAVMAELEEDGKKGDELAKAVDAAVRCGAMKGLE